MLRSDHPESCIGLTKYKAIVVVSEAVFKEMLNITVVSCRHFADKRIGTRHYWMVYGSAKQTQMPGLRALDVASWYEAAYYASYF